MSTEELEFAGDSIKVSGRSITTEHPIRNATLRGDKIIVLFEPDSVMGTFQNLVCLDLDGRIVWVAELPDTGKEDVYYQMSSTDPLVVDSFTSFECEISTQSGKILRQRFFK